MNPDQKKKSKDIFKKPLDMPWRKLKPWPEASDDDFKVPPPPPPPPPRQHQEGGSKAMANNPPPSQQTLTTLRRSKIKNSDGSTTISQLRRSYENELKQIDLECQYLVTKVTASQPMDEIGPSTQRIINNSLKSKLLIPEKSAVINSRILEMTQNSKRRRENAYRMSTIPPSQAQEGRSELNRKSRNTMLHSIRDQLIQYLNYEGEAEDFDKSDKYIKFMKSRILNRGISRLPKKDNIPTTNLTHKNKKVEIRRSLKGALQCKFVGTRQWVTKCKFCWNTVNDIKAGTCLSVSCRGLRPSSGVLVRDTTSKTPMYTVVRIDKPFPSVTQQLIDRLLRQTAEVNKKLNKYLRDHSFLRQYLESGERRFEIQRSWKVKSPMESQSIMMALYILTKFHNINKPKDKIGIVKGWVEYRSRTIDGISGTEIDWCRVKEILLNNGLSFSTPLLKSKIDRRNSPLKPPSFHLLLPHSYEAQDGEGGQYDGMKGSRSQHVKGSKSHNISKTAISHLKNKNIVEIFQQEINEDSKELLSPYIRKEKTLEQLSGEGQDLLKEVKMKAEGAEEMGLLATCLARILDLEDIEGKKIYPMTSKLEHHDHSELNLPTFKTIFQIKTGRDIIPTWNSPLKINGNKVEFNLD